MTQQPLFQYVMGSHKKVTLKIVVEIFNLSTKNQTKTKDVKKLQNKPLTFTSKKELMSH